MDLKRSYNSSEPSYTDYYNSKRFYSSEIPQNLSLTSAPSPIYPQNLSLQASNYAHLYNPSSSSSPTSPFLPQNLSLNHHHSSPSFPQNLSLSSSSGSGADFGRDFSSPSVHANYLQSSSSSSLIDIPSQLLSIELSLVQKLKPILIPPPVSYIYSPLEYAYEPHADYVRKYCQGRKKLVFLGMNPGPWGMSQTGVPFGEVNLVKNWLKVEGRIGKPLIEHPSRIIEGFNCPRSEVSGQRFWSYWKDLCKEPEVLFKYSYIHNYCPLAFMKDSGRNVTPPELKARERNQLFSACDDALIQVLRLLQPEIVIGVGKFPQQRTQLALQAAGLHHIRVESILHPSPVNPTANKGWRDVVHRQLNEMGLMQYFYGR